jgi:hypothetical protein
MGRPDGRIEPGQPLRGAISARAWNRAQDAADLVLGSETTGAIASQGFQSLPYTWLYVKMVVDVDVGDCVALTGFVTDTAYSEYKISEPELLRQIPVVWGTATKAGQSINLNENTCDFGIAVEPIKAMSVGRVAVSGVVACNVYINKLWHPYAKPKTGESILESSPNGSIHILFWQGRYASSAENVNKVSSALIRLGNPVPYQLIVVNTVANWDINTTKTLTLDNSVFPAGTGTNQIQVPGNFPTPGNIVARNVFCDIKQAGRGVCAQYGGEWILVNWTPAQYTVAVGTKSYEFSVPTYTIQ